MASGVNSVSFIIIYLIWLIIWNERIFLKLCCVIVFNILKNIVRLVRMSSIEWVVGKL